MRALLLAVFALLWVPATGAANTVALLASAEPVDFFLEYHNRRIQDFLQENATLSQASTERNAVLLGDSLTDAWSFNDRVARFLPGRRILNRGISADTVSRERGVYGRLDVSVFDCNPSHVFLLIGVNDLGDLGREGEPGLDVIEEHYRGVVSRITDERPGVDLTLTLLTPVSGPSLALEPLISQFNPRIQAIAAEFNLRVLDLGPFLADGEGHLRGDYTEDGLHFTDPVYAIWGSQIEAILASAEAGLAVPPDLAHWFPHGQARLVQFRRENAALQAVSPEQRHVVLLGSSTMEGWKNQDRTARFLPADHRILNRGISADRIGVGDFGIRHRLEESVFGCNPSHVVLQNGTNDLLVHAREGSPSIETIAGTYETVVATIQERLPGVPVAIVTVQPLRGRYAIGNEATLAFNERLRAIAARRGCFLIDHHPMLADEEGLLREDLTGDGLHFRDEGYRLMGEEIARFLRERPGQGAPSP